MSENELFMVDNGGTKTENIYGNAFNILERYDDVQLKVFIKRYLQSGVRYPFPGLHTGGTFYYFSLAKLISLNGNLILEERIKRIIRELLLESRGEFSEAKRKLGGASYNRFEYIFNLIGAATHFQSYPADATISSQFSSLDVIYNYAYNYEFKQVTVYGLNLHKFILKCLFSFNFPSSYEKRLLILCDESIELPICAPLCYREAYEINHLNSIKFFKKYLCSARELNNEERLDPLSFIHFGWAKRLFKKYYKYFIKQIYCEILKYRWVNDLECINFDLNLRNMDLREDACVLELRIDNELIFSYEIVDINIIKDIKKYHKIEPANSMLFGDPRKLQERYNELFGSDTTSRKSEIEAVS